MPHRRLAVTRSSPTLSQRRDAERRRRRSVRLFERLEDRHLLSGDSWGGIHALNLSEGESQPTDVVRYSLTVTDTSNVPLPDTNQDGIHEVTQGQTFRLHGIVQDVRSANQTTGVAAAYMNLMAANSNRISLRYGETQQLRFVPETYPGYPAYITGTFTLTLNLTPSDPLQAKTTQAINIFDEFDPNTDRAQLIQDALAALPNIGAGNVEVTTSLTDGNVFNIRFVNGLGERNVPGLTGNFSSLTHLQAGSVTDNFYPADISNPGTFRSSFAHVSPYIDDTHPNEVPTPGGSPLATVGSFFSIMQGWFLANPGEPKEFFTVDIQAQLLGEVDFWGGLPSTPAGHETLVWPSSSGNDFLVDPQFIGFVQDSATPLRLMITPRVTATDDNYSTDEDTPLVINATQGLLTNDSDAEGDSLQVTAVDVTGMHGQLTWSADGSFTYHPLRDFNGRDSFTYQAYDGLEHSNPATVTITVAPVNDAPVLQVPGALSVNQDTNLAVPGLQVNDVDAGASPIQVTLSASHGTISVAASASITGNGTGWVVLTGTLADINASLTGSVTYRGTAGFHGADALVIAASDLGHAPPPAQQALATIPLTVQAANYWHNAVTPRDVSNEGHISPLDVLLVINYLNGRTGGGRTGMGTSNARLM